MAGAVTVGKHVGAQASMCAAACPRQVGAGNGKRVPAMVRAGEIVSLGNLAGA